MKEMPEDRCFLINKDEVAAIRSSKKSPLVLQAIVFGIVSISGLYICFTCMSQVETQFYPSLAKDEKMVVEQQGHGLGGQFGTPQAHFPWPSTYSRGECASTPVRFFAILSMQRSGSGWFEALLNSHANISSNGEIFSAGGARNNITTIIDTLDRVYNLEWHSSAAKNECTAAVGLKWMLNQGLLEYHEEIAKYFEERGVSLIFLFRRNLLRRLVSVLANAHDRDAKQLNGLHKAHVHSKGEADILSKFKPEINTSSLIPSLNEMDRSTADALRYFHASRRMVVYYEDLISNPTEKVVDVLDFLGVPRRKLVSQHVKIHTKPLSEQVENWGDVYRVLKDTPYQRFIHTN